MKTRGVTSNTRHVCNILFGNEPADSLLVCEVITPSGGWSSYPPHKHDTDAAPAETQLEETYYHKIDPPQGFAFQRVYTDDRSIDETMAVEDGDLVMVPRRLSSCRRASWLSVLLFKCHGGTKSKLDIP